MPEAAPAPMFASPAAALAELRQRFARGDIATARALCESYFSTRRDLRDEYGHPIYFKESLRIALAAGETAYARELALRLGALLQPRDPCVHVLLARHHTVRGDCAAARAEWEAVLALAPGHTEARDNLAALRSAPMAADGSGPPADPGQRRRVADFFDGDVLETAESFEAFCNTARDPDAPDHRFVHASQSDSPAPFGGFVQGVTRFGSVRHRSEAAFAQGTARMQAVESVSLRSAIFAPSYCFVFSAERGIYRPSAGDFSHPSRGAAAVAREYPVFEIAPGGSLAIRNPEALDYQDCIGIPICAQGFPNYGHFLFDGLGLATFMAESLRRDGVRLIGQPLRPWQADVMRALGLDDIYVSLQRPTRFRRIVASNTLTGHVPHPTRFARLPFDLIRLRLGTSSEPRNRRIFIVRPDKPGRRYLVNRAEVANCFRAHDFEIVQPETLSFAEQVRLFSTAAVVAGESGAAMANIGFCDPGTQVLEIMPEIHNEIWTRGACLVFGHQWHVYFARVTERAPSEATGVERMNFRYIVDIEPLRDALRHICRDAPRGGNRTAPPAPLGRRIDELPHGPALVELEAERRPSQTYLFAESEQRTRKPPFYAEPLDLTVARFGTLLTDPKSRSYQASRITCSALPGASVIGSSGLACWEGRLIGDSTHSIEPWRPQTAIAEADNRRIRFKRPLQFPGRRLEGAWFHPFTGAWRNYAHWITECAPKLLLFRWLRERVPGVRLLIPDFGESQFQRRSMELLGLDPSQALLLGEDEVVTPDTLWLAPLIQVWCVPPICRMTAQELVRVVPAPANATDFAERIYIRRLAASRRMTNLEKITPVLQEFGFRIVSMETMTLDDQIRVMQHARYIIGEASAGLANIMFCRPGARVLEMFGPAQPQLAHWTLASLNEMDYGYIVGHHVPTPQMPKPGWNSHYAITPDQLARAIPALLGKAD
jgi:capsular polysaccharide biosynthesis protein